MNRYKVTSGVLHVSQGAKLQLSEGQAAPRAHNLEPAKGRKGLFTAAAPLQFKAGEELGLEDVAKSQLARIELIDPAA